MQVDPIKPKLKPPRIKCLKLRCVVPVSNFAIKFKFRRYPPGVKGEEAEGFRNEQRAYIRVLSAAAGFQPQLFKRANKVGW